ncbi:hypothetical protein, unlikely [Trypanosoma brucei gambiense DAL972]|uniref:Uncharacterized protein n=1 Tax=Trypanosoma brucei gambiense (strain MHOM/CI/86/DAL972) TaxID=679716 RepID=D0A7C0_TRYB9|nr:hypothetical protein, unlikely [Trypanosoma brucei gambiense DAL972]CBH17571.1 hypothetical protein, unlikely [Trypanosoma brucei gambiense DAL972]|eukprot:XP_011779835.1 hypothetical protein, unlikely [Trypanosoma brucei gambiense DAL972]
MSKNISMQLNRSKSVRCIRAQIYMYKHINFYKSINIHRYICKTYTYLVNFWLFSFLLFPSFFSLRLPIGEATARSVSHYFILFCICSNLRSLLTTLKLNNKPRVCNHSNKQKCGNTSPSSYTAQTHFQRLRTHNYPLLHLLLISHHFLSSVPFEEVSFTYMYAYALLFHIIGRRKIKTTNNITYPSLSFFFFFFISLPAPLSLPIPRTPLPPEATHYNSLGQYKTL